ncbi:MAG: hypothetical protein AAF725_20745 [Acidobacteriota bacterium]
MVRDPARREVRMMMRHRAVWSAGFLLFFLLVLAASAEGQPPEGQKERSLELVRELELPLPRFRRAADLRWAGEEKLAVADLREGVFTASTLTGQTDKAKLIRGAKERRGFWLAARLGFSNRFVVTAAPVHELAWSERGSGSLKRADFVWVVDLDLRGDQLLLLGQRRDEDGQVAPDGGILWAATLSEEPVAWTPRMFAADGPGPGRMDACAILELASVRFMRDGSYLVVPGIQPGVFLYAASGKLRRAWDHKALGFYADCDISTEQTTRLSADSEARQLWRNQRVLVEDLFELDSLPALLLRSHQGGETSWVAKILHPDGSTEDLAVPYVSSSPWTHLKVDVAGDVLAMLVREGIEDQRPEGKKAAIWQPSVRPHIKLFKLAK